jgi:hypothetical protein
MMTLLFTSLLVGAVLGQRYKVFILLPAMSLALICTITAGIVRAQDAWSIAMVAVCITTAMQIGYLIGTGIRAVLLQPMSQSVLDRIRRSLRKPRRRLAPLTRRAADWNRRIR